jgi:hypothetical protein
MSLDPEFLDVPLSPEPTPGEAHRRFVDELDWHLAEIEALRAELARVRAEADARHAAETAAALEQQKTILYDVLRRSITAEVEARMREDYLAQLKAAHAAREREAEAERAAERERHGRELLALEQSREALAREVDALKNRLFQEAEAAREARRSGAQAAADEKARALAEHDADSRRRSEEALAQRKAAQEKEQAELVAGFEQERARQSEASERERSALVQAHERELAELKKAHEKQLALAATQRDLELAQARRSLETAQEQAAFELRRRVQEEAQRELHARTERMKTEWDRLRARFD